MKLSFDGYRELCLNGKRIRATNSLIEFCNFINKFNGKFNIYTTLYSFNKLSPNGITGDYNTANVSSIFVDIDVKTSKGEKVDVVNEGKKLVEWLESTNYKFNINFSGRGLHFFIYTNNNKLNNPKIALKKFVEKAVSESGAIVDKSSFGDVAREVRVINTINLKSGLYCVPIKPEELTSIEEIALIARGQRKFGSDFIFGTKLVDLSQNDGESLITRKSNEKEEKVSTEINVEQFKKVYGDIPCIKDIIEDDHAGYSKRTMFITFMKNKGFTDSEINKVLQEFISDEKWNSSECTRTHVEKISKYNYRIASCKSYKSKGLCPVENQEECKYYNKLDLC